MSANTLAGCTGQPPKSPNDPYRNYQYKILTPNISLFLFHSFSSKSRVAFLNSLEQQIKQSALSFYANYEGLIQKKIEEHSKSGKEVLHISFRELPSLALTVEHYILTNHTYILFNRTKQGDGCIQSFKHCKKLEIKFAFMLRKNEQGELTGDLVVRTTGRVPLGNLSTAEKEFLESLENTQKVVRRILENPSKRILTVLDGGTYESKNRKKFVHISSLCRLGDLRAVVQARNLSLLQKEKFCGQVILSVESLHKRGIVHRDIKTENFLVDKGYKIKICDFGFSYLQEDLKTITQGTFDTFPPEILYDYLLAKQQNEALQEEQKEAPLKNPFNHFPRPDKKSDIYGLGLVLAEIFSGQCINNRKLKELFEISNDLKKIEEVFRKEKEALLNDMKIEKTPKKWIDLISRMLSLYAKDRPTILEIYEEVKKFGKKEEEEKSLLA